MDDSSNIHEITFRFSNVDLTDPEKPSSTTSSAYERGFGLTVDLDLATLDMDVFSTVIDSLLGKRTQDYPNPNKISVTAACYTPTELLAMDVQMLKEAQAAAFVCNIVRPLLGGPKAKLQVSIFASHDLQKVVEITAIERGIANHQLKYPKKAAVIHAMMERNRLRDYKSGTVKYTTFTDGRMNAMSIKF